MKFKLILAACLVALVFGGRIKTFLNPQPPQEQAAISEPAPAPAPATVATTPAPLRFFEQPGYSNPLDAGGAVNGSPSPNQNSTSAALQAAKQRIRSQINSSQ